MRSLAMSALSPVLEHKRTQLGHHGIDANEVKPGLPPWEPQVRFRRVQTLVREGSPLVKLRNSA